MSVIAIIKVFPFPFTYLCEQELSAFILMKKKIDRELLLKVVPFQLCYSYDSMIHELLPKASPCA